MKWWAAALLIVGWGANLAAAYWVVGWAPAITGVWRGVGTVVVGAFLGLVEAWVAVLYLRRVDRREREELAGE